MKKFIDITIDEILEKIDFSDVFIEDFKLWCEDKKKIHVTGGLLDALIYSGDPFIKMLSKDQDMSGKYSPVYVEIKEPENG